MTPAQYEAELHRLAEDNHRIQLEMEVTWPQHALAVFNQDGKKENEYREQLHSLLDARLDGVAAVNALRRKMGYLC